jgi:predicted amidohydrolase YtcJ
VQHRSGHAWYLNTAAAARIGRRGARDGALYDVDNHLRTVADPAFPGLDPLSRTLTSYGITAVTDAGVQNDAAVLAELRRASDCGELAQRCLVMGNAELDAASGHPRVVVGPRKLVVADDDMSGAADLAQHIATAGSRGVAIHAASLDALLVAAALLEEAGRKGQRIEHASVAPPYAVAAVARAHARVVANPGFVAAHGDRYLATVEPGEVGSLYRLRAWLAAGVPLAAGSDAPYGPLNPWAAMRAAVRRRTDSDLRMGPEEALEPEEALRLYTSPLDAPGTGTSAPRVGDVADLCLLAAPWAEARTELSADLVGVTILAGRPLEV